MVREKQLAGSAEVYPDSQQRGQNGHDRQQDRVRCAKAWRVGLADAYFAGDQKGGKRSTDRNDV